ncbi:basic proline-rich protein-like [Nyctibius grandis]|uniref:basic proline-rich protein-like n=1 Tax=Nyctibius grandis TaxID=48427 RepID=UPI0035BC0E06
MGMSVPEPNSASHGPQGTERWRRHPQHGSLDALTAPVRLRAVPERPHRPGGPTPRRDASGRAREGRWCGPASPVAGGGGLPGEPPGGDRGPGGGRRPPPGGGQRLPPSPRYKGGPGGRGPQERSARRPRRPEEALQAQTAAAAAPLPTASPGGQPRAVGPAGRPLPGPEPPFRRSRRRPPGHREAWSPPRAPPARPGPARSRTHPPVPLPLPLPAPPRPPPANIRPAHRTSTAHWLPPGWGAGRRAQSTPGRWRPPRRAAPESDPGGDRAPPGPGLAPAPAVEEPAPALQPFSRAPPGPPRSRQCRSFPPPAPAPCPPCSALQLPGHRRPRSPRRLLTAAAAWPRPRGPDKGERQAGGPQAAGAEPGLGCPVPSRCRSPGSRAAAEPGPAPSPEQPHPGCSPDPPGYRDWRTGRQKGGLLRCRAGSGESAPHPSRS